MISCRCKICRSASPFEDGREEREEALLKSLPCPVEGNSSVLVLSCRLAGVARSSRGGDLLGSFGTGMWVDRAGLLSGVMSLVVGVLLRVTALGGGGAMVAFVGSEVGVVDLGCGGLMGGESSSSLRFITSGRLLVFGVGVVGRLRGVLLDLAAEGSGAFLGRGVWGGLRLFLPAFEGFNCSEE